MYIYIIIYICIPVYLFKTTNSKYKNKNYPSALGFPMFFLFANTVLSAGQRCPTVWKKVMQSVSLSVPPRSVGIMVCYPLII